MIAQIENAFLSSLRNAFVRRVPESARMKQLAFLYNADLGETIAE